MSVRAVRTDPGWGIFIRVVLYTISIFVVQAVWISRLPYPAIRVDLMAFMARETYCDTVLQLRA